MPVSPRPWALLLAAALTLASCSTPAARGLSVVAAENFYGSVASQVGGPGVHVTSIIEDPSADPHEYTSNVQDAEAVASARLVVINGAGYDSFMDRLVASSSGSARTIVHVDRLLGTRGADPNPHLWYDPRTPIAVADAIAADLARIDPAHATAYRRNARRFIASLAPIRAEIASLHGRFAGISFAYTERVPGYLTAAIGLALKTPPEFAKADEDGTDPPPQAVAAMRGLVTGHRIRLLLYNAQASSQPAASIRSLAEDSGVPVVAVSETSAPGETYQHWQLAQLRAIDAALSKR